MIPRRTRRELLELRAERARKSRVRMAARGIPSVKEAAKAQQQPPQNSQPYRGA